MEIERVKKAQNRNELGINKSTISRILTGKYYHSADDEDESDDGSGSEERVDNKEEKDR